MPNNPDVGFGLPIKGGETASTSLLLVADLDTSMEEMELMRSNDGLIMFWFALVDGGTNDGVNYN